MIWVLIIGLMVGIVAKFIMPGPNPGGIIMTMILGIAGAMLANWAGGAFGIYGQGEPVGFIAAVIGAMVILFLFQVLSRGKRAN